MFAQSKTVTMKKWFERHPKTVGFLILLTMMLFNGIVDFWAGWILSNAG